MHSPSKPRFGGLPWAYSLTLYELAHFGLRSWWWKLHWAIHREFGDLDISALVRQKGGNHPGPLSYGETPTITLKRILEMAEIPPARKIVDLGMGRGLAVFAAALLGHQSAGLELVPEYVVRARRVADRLSLSVSLLEGNMLTAEWPKGDLYLLNSTAFPTTFRRVLSGRLGQLDPGTQVVTFDWSLQDTIFQTVSQARLPVTWGTVDCRVFRKRG